MKKTITFFIACILAIANLFANTEELLGEYHFNDATDYWQVGESDAITMGAAVTPVGWTRTINDENNGLFRAFNTQTRNYGFPPLTVFVEPKTGFTIWVSKIEIKHKTTGTVTGINQRFAYVVNPTSTPTTTNVIWGPFIMPTSADDFTTLTLTFETPVQVTDNKFWFYNAILANVSGMVCTTEVDYVKIYGTYLDPTAPQINTPLTVQSIKGAKVGQSSSRVVDITHVNLEEPLSINISSSNPVFTASFDDAEKTKLNVVYTSSQTGFETGDITLTSGSASAVVQVKGWGLPDNTLAAWSFENQTIDPDYYAQTSEVAAIESVGPSSGVFFFNESWTYEIINLYTKVEDVEVPEISGMKIKNLGYTGMITLQFDIRARNPSPNTMKVGTYSDNLEQWSSGVYWRNPKTGLGWETAIQLDVQIYNGEFSIVSAFDQTLEPPRFEKINITNTEFINDTGWALDNIIVMSIPGGTTETKNISVQSRLRVYNNAIHITNNDQKAKIEVIALNGIVQQSVEISGNAVIPVNLKGLYLVRMTTAKGNFTQKAVF